MADDLKERWKALLAAVQQELTERGIIGAIVEGDYPLLRITILSRSGGRWSDEIDEGHLRTAAAKRLAIWVVIRWHHQWVNVSHLLAEEYVGFEAVDDGLWEVFFGPVWLGRFHEATSCIVDQFGHPARREGGNHKGKGKVSTIS